MPQQHGQSQDQILLCHRCNKFHLDHHDIRHDIALHQYLEYHRQVVCAGQEYRGR